VKLLNTGSRGCLAFPLTWLLVAASVWLTAVVVPGVHVATFWPDALLAAVVIGLLNALVRPLLVLLTLPATLLTLGLFLLVLNGALLELADRMLAGFSVDTFGAAVLGSVVLSLASWLLDRVVFGPPEKKE